MYKVVLNHKFPDVDYVRYNPEDGVVQEVACTTCARLNTIHKFDVEEYRKTHGELHPTISLAKIGFWFGKTHTYQGPLS